MEATRYPRKTLRYLENMCVELGRKLKESPYPHEEVKLGVQHMDDMLTRTEGKEVCGKMGWIEAARMRRDQTRIEGLCKELYSKDCLMAQLSRQLASAKRELDEAIKKAASLDEASPEFDMVAIHADALENQVSDLSGRVGDVKQALSTIRARQSAIGRAMFLRVHGLTGIDAANSEDEIARLDDSISEARTELNTHEEQYTGLANRIAQDDRERANRAQPPAWMRRALILRAAREVGEITEGLEPPAEAENGAGIHPSDR